MILTAKQNQKFPFHFFFRLAASRRHFLPAHSAAPRSGAALSEREVSVCGGLRLRNPTWIFIIALLVKNLGGEGVTAITHFFRNSKASRRSLLVVSATRDPSCWMGARSVSSNPTRKA
jgi:hypothetical protein